MGGGTPPAVAVLHVATESDSSSSAIVSSLACGSVDTDRLPPPLLLVEGLVLLRHSVELAVASVTTKASSSFCPTRATISPSARTDLEGRARRVTAVPSLLSAPGGGGGERVRPVGEVLECGGGLGPSAGEVGGLAWAAADDVVVVVVEAEEEEEDEEEEDALDPADVDTGAEEAAFP